MQFAKIAKWNISNIFTAKSDSKSLPAIPFYPLPLKDLCRGLSLQQYSVKEMPVEWWAIP
jgi:hypothetical protein